MVLDNATTGTYVSLQDGMRKAAVALKASHADSFGHVHSSHGKFTSVIRHWIRVSVQHPEVCCQIFLQWGTQDTDLLACHLNRKGLRFM